jgi:enoyl-CoA hydratase/carnithine racemase
VSFDALRYAVEDGVCTLTLDRPDKLNAVTGAMIDEMLRALDRADADDAVRAVIVTLSPSTGMPPFYPWWADRPFDP